MTFYRAYFVPAMRRMATLGPPQWAPLTAQPNPR